MPPKSPDMCRVHFNPVCNGTDVQQRQGGSAACKRRSATAHGKLLIRENPIGLIEKDFDQGGLRLYGLYPAQQAGIARFGQGVAAPGRAACIRMPL